MARSRPKTLRTILFDLDGTLADTAPDLAFALNRLRSEQGLEALPFEMIRRRVSDGTSALIQLAFDLNDMTDLRFRHLRERFLEIYEAHLARETRLFPGMEQVLDEIEKRGLFWGIVTNKLEGLTAPLIMALGISKRVACMVSGDSTANRKPHPEPLLHAARLSGSAPPECLYVGDSQSDIIAGREAGMMTLIALYGYIDPAQDTSQWGAHGSISEPSELLDWLDLRPRKS